jgi:N-acetylmuramoyl-L-alanine amidase
MRVGIAAVGHEGDHVAAVQEALAGFGYGLDVSGVYDTRTQACMAAFQRRFRPERIDGVTDQYCLTLLKDLLDQLGRLMIPRTQS